MNGKLTISIANSKSLFLPYLFIQLFESVHTNQTLRIQYLGTQQFSSRYVLIDFGPAVRVFANGPGVLGSIPGRVIPKTLKMELDTTLLNTQHYKVRFKGKVEQSWEWSSALPYTLVQQLSKREPSGHPRLWSLTLLLLLIHSGECPCRTNHTF